MNTRTLATALASALLAGSAFATGLLIPKDESIPPLAIKHQRVDIAIKDGVATARIEQVFKNSVDRDLEAVFVFPLPENASISDFAMYINGRRMTGELVEKGKARQIYEDIVRRLKDPALLEYMGGNLFRISIFPVPRQGEQRIELEYSQTLAFDAGLYSFVYPLKTGGRASRTLEDFTVGVRLQSAVPIKSIYSPSHEVGITRKGDHEAVIGFEQSQYMLDRDFVLYYGVSKKAFGLNLLAHAAKGQEGTYMLLLAPSLELPEGAALKKDVAFVLDTSGSMQGKKIEQARGALDYCVKRLNDGDRFTIIRFSTDVETLSDTLLTVDAASRAKAAEFVKGITARGGTAIDGALARALALDYAADRPRLIVFLTDGKPTIGESSTDAILANVKKANAKPARIFVFGVGDEVNTHLLDRLAGENGGLPRYVTPEEDIEAKVSSFADKMSNPVLAKVAVQVDKIKTSKVYPQALPDLFSGDQLTILGRYAGDGHVAIRLTGEVDGKQREFVFEDTFPAEEAANSFIPRLWATRRVGHLLDEIRLHGEEGELKNEVIQLSKEHGIMTPYTSYLVLEDDKAYQDQGIVRPAAPKPAPPAAEVFAKKEARDRELRRAGAGGGVGAAPAAAPEPAMVPVFGNAADAAASAPPARSGASYRVVRQDEQAVQGYLRSESGAKAVDLSAAIHRYKTRATVGEDLHTVRHVNGKVFYLIGERWVDGAFREDLKVAHVAFGSPEYFALLKRHPALKAAFALGAQVTVVLPDGTAVIVDPA